MSRLAPSPRQSARPHDAVPAGQSKNLEPQMHADARRWTVPPQTPLAIPVISGARLIEIEQYRQAQTARLEIVGVGRPMHACASQEPGHSRRPYFRNPVRSVFIISESARATSCMLAPPWSPIHPSASRKPPTIDLSLRAGIGACNGSMDSAHPPLEPRVARPPAAPATGGCPRPAIEGIKALTPMETGQ